MGALFATGCTTTGTDAPAASQSVAPAAGDIALSAEPLRPETLQLDPRALTYKDALLAAGIPSSQSNSTTLMLAEGICRQIGAGTGDPAILENLRPLAAYTASLSGGHLTGDQVAQIYLDKARTSYC